MAKLKAAFRNLYGPPPPPPKKRPPKKRDRMAEYRRRIEGEKLRQQIGKEYGQQRTEFSDEQKHQIEILAGVGLPQRQIGLLLGVGENTLKTYCEAQLKTGEAKATAKVAQTLYSKAIAGDNTCMIFWLKCRAGWKETQHFEHTGANGGPIVMIDRPPAETRDEWIARRTIELDHTAVLMGSAAGTAD